MWVQCQPSLGSMEGSGNSLGRAWVDMEFFRGVGERGLLRAIFAACSRRGQFYSGVSRSTTACTKSSPTWIRGTAKRFRDEAICIAPTQFSPASSISATAAKIQQQREVRRHLQVVGTAAADRWVCILSSSFDSIYPFPPKFLHVRTLHAARLAKLSKIESMGIDPWGHHFPDRTWNADVSGSGPARSSIGSRMAVCSSSPILTPPAQKRRYRR